MTTGEHFLRKPEKFKTLYLDPGEDAGWCIANGPKLLAAGTEKMWILADYIWMALSTGGADGPLGCGPKALAHSRKGVGQAALEPPIGRIVCEDFRLYPWKINEMKWDPVRTARLIGGVTMMSRVYDLPFFLQPAKIKKQAVLLGTEEYYYHPLNENRHQNDAIQHWVYFRAFGPDGDSSSPNEEDDPEDKARYEACGAVSSVKRVVGRKTRFDYVECSKPAGHEGQHAYV